MAPLYNKKAEPQSKNCDFVSFLTATEKSSIMAMGVWMTILVTKFMTTTLLLRPPFLFPLLEHDLYWLFVLLLFAVSVYIGTTITNFFYRGMSWEDMIMTDIPPSYGVRGIVLEKYLLTIGIISFVVVFVLDACVSVMFVVSPGG